MSKILALKFLKQYRDHCQTTVDGGDDTDLENLIEIQQAIEWVKKQEAGSTVTQSCDTCKHLGECRFWAEAPNNGATCKFYIKHE